MIYSEQVTIVRPVRTRDAYGDDVATSHQDLDPGVLVAVQPAQSGELAPGQTGRELVTTGWRLITPPGRDIDLLPSDQVRWRDRLHEVVGDVARWPHPLRRGGVHHVEALLQRVT